jgi:ABC-type transport system involved in multi-copper enzyme maturation permease subunit
MMTLTRLAFRIQRFELVSVALLVAALAIAALVVRDHLVSLTVPTSCFLELLVAGPMAGTDCVASAQQFFEVDNSEALPLMQAFGMVALLVGGLLGVGMVSREIETGTASFAWALAGSRRRWLLGRLLPIVVVVIALLAVLAVTSDALLAARQPWVAPEQSLVDLDGHGSVLVLRGLVALLVGVLVGLLIGRTLPTVIVSTVVVMAVALSGVVFANLWLRSNITYTTEAANIVSLPGGYFFGTMSRGVDGVVIPDDAALSMAPAGVDPLAWVAEHYENVYAVVPGSLFGRYTLLEALLAGALITVLMVAILVAIERRRPS